MEKSFLLNLDQIYTKNNLNLLKLKLEELTNYLKHLNQKYYNENISLISDFDYDNLKRQHIYLLNKLEEYISNDLNTVDKKNNILQIYQLGVGTQINANSQFTKLKHIKPMLSLDNVFNEAELNKNFIKKIENFLNVKNYKEMFCIEPKIDGISFAAIYIDGFLQYVSTRGDGKIGEDITQNMLTIQNFPNIINILHNKNQKIPYLLEIRGEIFITKNDFIELNKMQIQNNLPEFANPRNAAGGSLRNLDPEVTKQRKLQYIAYEISSYYFNKSDLTHEILNILIENLNNLSSNNNNLSINNNYINNQGQKTIENQEKIQKIIDSSETDYNKTCAFEFHDQATDNANIKHIDVKQKILLDLQNQKNNLIKLKNLDSKHDSSNSNSQNTNFSYQNFSSDYKNIDTDSQNLNYELEHLNFNSQNFDSKSFYNLSVDNLISSLNNNQYDNLLLLNNFGFNVFLNQVYITDKFNIHQYYENFLTKKEEISYELDGLVIKVNLLKTQDRLGATNKAPRYAIAYKFPATQVITKILSVEYQIGRTGVITPVAILDPVLLSGVMISKATLHNFDDIKKKDIKINDFIFLVRSGDVIPKITHVDKSKRDKSCIDIEKINNCPSCKSILIEDSVFLRCENTNCDDILIHKLLHFASILEIKNLGIQQIKSLFYANIIRNFSCIFDIKNKINEILLLPRFGKKLVNNLLSSIENAKKTTLANFIYALGVPKIGKNNADLIANKFTTIENLIQAAEKSDFQDLLEIDGIGLHIVNELIKFSFTNIDEIKNLQNIMQILPPQQNNNQKLSNMSFVFTGKLSISRNEAKNLVEKNGGIIKNSISSDVILIAGEDSGSKLKKAIDANIKILSEKEFLELFKK